MKKTIRNVAMAGLLAAGVFTGSVQAQPAPVPTLAELTANVRASCVLTTPITPFDQQSVACQTALRALLAAYPNDPTAIALAVSYVGQDQVDLLLLETGSVIVEDDTDLGGDGDAPETPS